MSANGELVTLGEQDRHAWDREHATRAELLRRLGRSEESRAAYARAIELAGNTAETAYLSRRRDEPAGADYDGNMMN